MASPDGTYGPNTDGISYQISGPTGLFSTYTLTVLDGSTTVQTVTGLSSSNIITTSNTSSSLLSIGAGDYAVVPGATDYITVTASVLSATTLYIGGTAFLSESASLASSVTANVQGGTLTLSSGSLANALSSFTVNLSYGGELSLGSGLISLLSGTTINFGAGGGTFVANAGGTTLDLSGLTINGFSAATSKVEFQDLPSEVQSYVISTSGSSQTITLYSDTAHTNAIGSVTIAGTSLTAGTYVAGSSGPLTINETSNGSGYNITMDVQTAIVPCFLAGTLIDTPNGPVAIENLRIGDFVLNADDIAVAVRWIGRKTVSPRFADPLRTLPVRIKANALGVSLPSRDLLISPDHAVFLNGVLVNAGALVNGTSITRENITENFVYYHVEVDDHDLILAEGLPAETFIDNIDRMAFDNWAEHAEIFGQVTEKCEMDYPRAKSARQLPRSLRAYLNNLDSSCERSVA